MPLLPESLRGRAESIEADPFRYLRGVLAFFLGGGAVIALLLGLTGYAPGALVLAALLWTLFGVISGLVDWVLEPALEFGAEVLSGVGLAGTGGGFSAEETLVAEGRAEAAAEAYRRRAEHPRQRVTALVRRAELLAGPLQHPQVAVAELEALQRDASQLSVKDDLQVGLALASLYEDRLHDPGRALVEVRRLLDRHPGARQARELRVLLAALRTQQFAGTAP